MWSLYTFLNINSFDLLQSMRSGSIYGFCDSKVQIYSGSNSGFMDLILNFLINSSD